MSFGNERAFIDYLQAEEGVEKARIRTGALVSCDFHYCRWKDDGEIFTVEDFGCEGRKRLIADGYGSKGCYGNGAVYAKEEDLIYVKGGLKWRVYNCVMIVGGWEKKRAV